MVSNKERMKIQFCRHIAAKAQNNRCLYCTTRLTKRNVTADHCIPVSRGGETTLDNIDAVCGWCNKRKGSYTKQQFRKAINNPNLSRDGWDLYIRAMQIRIQRQTEQSIRNIRSIIVKERHL